MPSSMKPNGSARIACLMATLSLTVIATGCTQDEMDSAMAGAGIALIGASIVDSADSGHRHYEDRGHYECVSGQRTVCQESRDYFGRTERVCRTQYDPCVDRRYVRDYRAEQLMSAEMMDEDMAVDASALAAADDSQVNAVSMAQTFGLSFDAAETILNALKNAQSGDTQALNSLGLSADDRRAIASLSMPTDAGVDSMARTLNQDPAIVQSMLSRLIELGKQRQQAQASITPYMIN